MSNGFSNCKPNGILVEELNSILIVELTSIFVEELTSILIEEGNRFNDTLTVGE